MRNHNTSTEFSQDAVGESLFVANLTKTFADGEVTAVDEVSFEVEPGSIVGLLGPNGAGKTTTIKMILGTLVPDDGHVQIGDRDVHQNLRWLYANVGVMLEGSRAAYWRLTVRENLKFFTRLNGVPAAARRDRHTELLHRFNLEDKADVPVRKLSRGQKQKVAVARALAQDVKLVLLDEPTLGLDVESSLTLQRELHELVEERDLTVIITSHDMEVIENLCDRAIVLSDGRVIADDSISNLLVAFESNAYRVRVSTNDPNVVESKLRTHFRLTDIDKHGELDEYTVTLEDGTIHELSDVLRQVDGSVESLDTVSPNLEDVFLSITSDEKDTKGLDTEVVSRA